MKCPYCGYAESKVIDSRPLNENDKIRRRRECMNCNKRFTTYEIVERLPIIVIKRDGSREAFDSTKLFNGLLRACSKRQISTKTLEEIVENIELRLENSLEKEVESKKIGEYTMELLKKVDEVAYIRFASVYKQFQDIDTFMQELESLKNK